MNNNQLSMVKYSALEEYHFKALPYDLSESCLSKARCTDSNRRQLTLVIEKQSATRTTNSLSKSCVKFRELSEGDNRFSEQMNEVYIRCISFVP